MRSESFIRFAGKLSFAVSAPAISPARVTMALPPPEPASYRVFRHDELGLHFVLRDVEELAGYTCVHGPVDAEGLSLTFPEAVAFANQAFADWSERHRRFSASDRASVALAGLQMQAAEMPVLFGI